MRGTVGRRRDVLEDSEGLFNQEAEPRGPLYLQSQSRLPPYNCLLSAGNEQFNEISTQLSVGSVGMFIFGIIEIACFCFFFATEISLN